MKRAVIALGGPHHGRRVEIKDLWAVRVVFPEIVEGCGDPLHLDFRQDAYDVREYRFPAARESFFFAVTSGTGPSTAKVLAQEFLCRLVTNYRDTNETRS